MASPSSIWSAQLDPISTWSLTKGQADWALFLYITSSSSKKSLKTKSRKLRSYYRHCCGAPRGFVRRSAIGPQELREVQGLPLPPTSFLPCRVRLSGGRREAYFLLLGAEKKVCFVSEKKKPTFRGHLAVPACARKGRELARGDPRLLLKTWFLIYSCYMFVRPPTPLSLLQ